MDAGHRRARLRGITRPHASSSRSFSPGVDRAVARAFALASLVSACGGSDRGAARAGADRDPAPETDVRAASPSDGALVGGGQTTDFGDGLGSACDYAVDTLSRAAALDEGWPVDADLALLEPAVRVALQREGSSCETQPGAAGALLLRSELVGIHVARGAPIPEAPPGVECDDLLSYGVAIQLEASDGWITGLFHAELASDGAHLYGSAFEAADGLRGALSLQVDRSRPHQARANLSLELAPSSARGELNLAVYYADGREPLIDIGERLLWPPSADARCSSEPVHPTASGASWLTLDAYQRARAP